MNNSEPKTELDPQTAPVTKPEPDPQPAAIRKAAPDKSQIQPEKWVIYFVAFNMILLAVKGGLTYGLLVLSLVLANTLHAEANMLMIIDLASFFITFAGILLIIRPIIARFFLDRYYIKGALITAGALQLIGAAITFTAPVALTVKLVNFTQVLLPAIACFIMAFQNYDRITSEAKKCYSRKAKIALVLSCFVLNIVFNILRSPSMISSLIDKLF